MNAFSIIQRKVWDRSVSPLGNGKMMQSKQDFFYHLTVLNLSFKLQKLFETQNSPKIHD